MTEIAIAFDVAGIDRALELDDRIGAGPELAKIGLELFTAAGPDAVRVLKGRGRRVFLDLKLHDIPNTVQRAAREAALLGAELLTVHALGGEAMIAAAVAGVAEAGASTGIIAVTVLTSHDPQRMPPGFERPFALDETAEAMLAMATRAGAKGIVCSAADLPDLRRRHPKPFYAVTPGIRPAGITQDDQQRVTTVADAVAAGSGLMVIGRPVSAADDPRAALASIRTQRDEAVGTLQP